MNKTENNVQLLHRPTGIRVSCQETRSLATNRRLARRLILQKVSDFFKLLSGACVDERLCSWMKLQILVCRKSNFELLSRGNANGADARRRRRNRQASRQTMELMKTEVQSACMLKPLGIYAYSTEAHHLD